MLSMDPTQATIRVAIIDSCPIFRIGLEIIFQGDPRIRTVLSDSHYGGLQAQASYSGIDVVVTDMTTSNLEQANLLSRLQQEYPHIQILAFVEPGHLASIIVPSRLIIRGFQVKTAATDEILSSLIDVHAGKPVMAGCLANEFFNRVSLKPQLCLTGLSERQAEVLKMIAHGQTNNQIASKLSISEATVKFHVSSIFTKLRVKNRTEAAKLLLTRVKAA